MRSRVFHVKQACLAVLLLAFLTSAIGCALSRDPITGKKRPLGYSWQQERQLGAQADQQITAQMGIYEGEGVQSYVERIGQQVLAQSHLRRPDAPQEFKETPFTFRVLDSEVINAFALPGGYVYVTRGLLTHLGNEAQLAMVLGHEVAHVAARHAAERAFQQQLGQVALIGGAILGQQVLGLPAEDLLNLGGAAAQLLFLSYGRDDEREADRFGVEYSALAGYQSGEGSEFFRSLERIQEKEGQSLPSWASTHPEPGEREETIKELAREWAGRTSMTTVDQEEYLRKLDGVIAGANPRNGYSLDGVFYHPDLRFQFPVPRGFQLINQATKVLMVDQQQQAIVGFQIAEASSAQEAAATFARQQGIQVLESGRSTNSRVPGHYVLVDAPTQQGATVRALALFIDYRDRVYSFVGYTEQSVFDQYADRFWQTMRGFAPVTDPAILNIQPARIDIVAAPRTAPFRDFVSGNLPLDFTPAELAIMNQVELDETIQQGTLLKMVRQ